MSRYIRQSQFAPIGIEGQSRIEASEVVILGCGALGSVAAELLARAGVGTLRLIDRDVVEWSNLQRQGLYVESDAIAGRAKVEAAADHLRKINSQIVVQEIAADVTPENIRNCIGRPDLVIDASDNFSLRLLLNDFALENRMAWVHGGCVGATGQVRLFDGGTVTGEPHAAGAPCFRCLVPSLPDPSDVATCDTAGVIGPATHLIASLQAGEALKWLSGNREAVRTDVLSIDLWSNQIRSVQISPELSRDCPACGRRDFEFLRSTGAAAESLCGRDAVQISGGGRVVNLAAMAERWEKIAPTQKTRFFVRLKLPTERTSTEEMNPHEGRSLTLFRDGRAVVTGTSEITMARVLYDRYVGS